MFLYSDGPHFWRIIFQTDAWCWIEVNVQFYSVLSLTTKNAKFEDRSDCSDSVLWFFNIFFQLYFAISISSPPENSLHWKSSSSLSGRDSSVSDSDPNNFFKYAVLSAAVNLQIKYCKIHYYLIFISTMVFYIESKLHITLSCKFFFQQFFVVLSIYFS